MIDLFGQMHTLLMVKCMSFMEKEEDMKEFCHALFCNLIVKFQAFGIPKLGFDIFTITNRYPMLSKWNQCKTWSDLHSFIREETQYYSVMFMYALRDMVKETFYDAPIFLHWTNRGMQGERPVLSQSFPATYSMFGLIQEERKSARSHACDVLANELSKMNAEDIIQLEEQCMSTLKKLMSYANTENHLDPKNICFS